MDPLLLEQEALKLAPLARIQLADLLYASLEEAADRDWERKVVAECESRYGAYQRGEMGAQDAFEALDRLRAKYVK